MPSYPQMGTWESLYAFCWDDSAKGARKTAGLPSQGVMGRIENKPLPGKVWEGEVGAALLRCGG